ncbi:hypothetical protein EBZ57_00290 [bacterium]|nr:hypothetical protein [bacterium]
MRGGKTKTGYTITEVLIVLAISSAMFIAANAFISGRVAETSFRTGVNEMASRIQDIINQVSSGQFSDRPLNCSIDLLGNINPVAGTNEQATKKDCIYLGKKIKFSSPEPKYTIATLAGKRLDGVQLSSIGLKEVSVIDTSNVISGGLYPTANQTFGFVLNPDGSLGDSSLSAQNILLIDADNNIINNTTGLSVCLTNGRFSAKVTVGDNKNVLGVKTDFFYGRTNCT